MLPPPPTSTPFPYTTLFRSFVSFWRNRDYLRSDNTLDSLVSRESSFLFNNLILLVACVAVISGTLFPVLSDRKSTRLNSSHSSISYAVFCLKKKKSHYRPIR